jgi:hypothetical protein
MKRLLVLAGTACLMASLLPADISAQNPAAGATAAAPKPAAKAWTPRRLSDGQPDIQGVWTNYDNTPFQTPSPEDDKALAALREWFPPGDQTGPGSVWENDGSVGASRKNPRRKAMVVQPENGRVPVKPEAAAKKDYALAHLTDAWENHTPWERCITRGVPGGIFPGGYGAGYRIVQAPGVVVIFYEMIHETRIIPVNGMPHAPAAIHQWNGDSRGRWDGNTLIVDITNYNDKSSIATNIASQAMRGIGQSDRLHVVERFTIVDENRLDYEATIEDPGTYTAPWKVSMPINRDSKYELYEYACHEGNYALPNTLRGARLREAGGSNANSTKK